MKWHKKKLGIAVTKNNPNKYSLFWITKFAWCFNIRLKKYTFCLYFSRKEKW